MSEGDPRTRVIPLETLNDAALTRFHVLQAIGREECGVNEEQLLLTVVAEFKTPGARFAFDPHNSLDELVSGLCNSGMARRKGEDGTTTLQLTQIGHRVLTHLPQGISEKLGIKPQPAGSPAMQA